MIHTRAGCFTISFRHLDLDSALATIAEVGFAEIDLGALPGFRPRACASYTRCFPEFLGKELFGSSCVRSIDNRPEHGENSATD